MAQRTVAQGCMIPVAEWFGRQREEASAAPGGSSDASAIVDAVPFDPVADAYRRGHEEGMAEGHAAAMQAHAAEIASWKAQLAACEQQWSSRLSSRMAEEVRTAIDMVLHQMESAVAGVLTPFLEERVRMAASARLRELALQEIARHGSRLIEVHAPVELHEPLREALSDRGVPTAIAVDDAVRIVGRDGTTIFESLAERWIALLRGEV